MEAAALLAVVAIGMALRLGRNRRRMWSRRSGGALGAALRAGGSIR